MLKNARGDSINEKNFRVIAAGGEGEIYEYTKGHVMKIYFSDRKAEFGKHLESLFSLSDTFVKPLEVLYTLDGKVGGFTMKYVPMNNYFLFNNLFNKGFCTSHGIDKAFKIRLLEKLKAAVEELHNNNIQVGDLNPYNLLFSDGGDLLVVDVDSFQTKDHPHSMVLLQDIQDFTTTSVTKQTDIWAYDILSFWATTYMHPFKWVAKDNKDTFEQKVRQGKSILSKIPNIKIPPIYEAPQGNIETQFRDIFGGRRYFIDFGGMVQPTSVVIKQTITSTALTIRELFSNVTQVNVCGDYIAVKSDKLWHLVETKIPKITRQVQTSDYDKVYPSNNKFGFVEKDKFSSDNHLIEIDFIQPEFFYYNGFLTVIDYGTDIQHNFNLNNQLGGIDRTQTPVFAKSIVIRDTPIQNFGGKKYLNLPRNNTYFLSEVNFTVKNAIYDGGVIAEEYTEKNQIVFRIHSDQQHNGGLELDYLPYFTCKGPNVLLPEDGFISVLKDWTPIAKLDASMCTRQSKLYSCNSGILLLENNILYLLNTK